MELRPARILGAHQGSEFYGSDRSFLQAVEALCERWVDAEIEVVLAADGPLRLALSSVASRVRVRDLCVLRLATPIATALRSTVAFPYFLARAAADIAWADLAYVNITVIADYMVEVRTAPAKPVIHAREIPKPRTMPLVLGLIRASGARVSYNSDATRAAFGLVTDRPHAVIHNGVDPDVGAAAPELPGVFSGERPLRIVMLGRINDWKGQDPLVEALARLPGSLRPLVRARIVGSTYQNAHAPVAALEVAIAAAGLGDVVRLEPFRDDPSEVYRWADLCVVPSRLPEPFGRVAIEAMAHGRAVIAAAHGGLVEIVGPGRSGWLVAPNDADALASAISEAIADPARLNLLGAGALVRFFACFSDTTMRNQLQGVLEGWILQLAKAR